MAEILGWTDHTMIETAERLDSSVADRMRRSTTVPVAVAYWSYAIKNRQNIPSELARLVDFAAKERNKIASLARRVRDQNRRQRARMASARVGSPPILARQNETLILPASAPV